MTQPATATWCEQRDHPWVTYNPHMDRTWCRCGARQADGAMPMDWQAKHEVFHTCPYEQTAGSEPCRCYTSERP